MKAFSINISNYFISTNGKISEIDMIYSRRISDRTLPRPPPEPPNSLQSL
jgi:hypothetical protein